MFNYTDLINTPYGKYGNCYGFLVECCRRNGTPLKDPFSQLKKLPAGSEAPYIEDLNVREIDKPKAGAIVECEDNGNLHVGFLVSKNLVIHTTHKTGARVTHIAALKVIKYYEVEKNDSNSN